MRRLLAALVLVLCGNGVLHADDDTPSRAIRRGERSLGENRLDDAVAAFQQCMQVAVPRYDGCAYGLAQAYSRKQDAAKALEWLARAADWGYEDVTHILADANLANIRSNGRYGQILDAIQRRFPASRARPYTASDKPERGMELVAMVRGDLGRGAGIILSHEGNRVYLVTANHVVRKGGAAAKTIEIQLKALAPRWHRAELLPAIADSELDLAILAVDGIIGPNFDFCTLPMHLGGDSSRLHRGDAVYPVGYPGGILWAMPLSPDHASQVFPSQISFESQFMREGFSGGALLDKQGEVVGMITADEPPLGRAVPLGLILDAARKAGYPVQLSRSDPGVKLPLLEAAKAGDVSAIRRLLGDCAVPNAADTTGRTALHEAAAQGSSDAVRLLLAAGAGPNAWAVIRDDDSEREWGTPLHVAAEHGRVEAVKALLASGDVDLETLVRKDGEKELEKGSRALHVAARHDRGDVAEVLLAAGADLERRDEEDHTPLGVAAMSGSVGAARVLLQHGAAWRSSDPNSAEIPPLHLASAAGKVNVLELFLSRGADVNTTNPGSYVATPLHAAAANGQLQAVAFLIAHKAIVDAPGYEGNTPLFYAAKMGTRAVVELLLANGADPNKRSGPGEGSESPIEAASGRDDVEVLQALVNAKADIGYLLHRVLDMEKADAARILIKGGADVSLKDATGRQPLHVAATRGMSEAVELLLAAGAPVDAIDGDGRTPLHRAAASHQPKIVDLLIAAKASLNVRNGSGSTPLFLAVPSNHSKSDPSAIVSRLLKAGADPNIESSDFGLNWNTPVAVAAASNGSAESLALLLAAGGNPNRRGSAALSPLSLAAESDDAEKKVRLLLKAGAKVMDEEEEDSPLHAAVHNRDAGPAVIRLLLAAGAPVDRRNKVDRTPLQEAADKKNIEAVKVLLSGGASVNPVDKTCGVTPLWLALSGSNGPESHALVLAEILVAAGADVNSKNSCEEGTLLELAEKSGYWKVRQLLLSKGAK